MPETTNQSTPGAKGRILALPEDEDRRRIEATLRAMDEFFLMGDAEEQAATHAALVKGIEEDRMAGRPRFAL